VAKKDTKGGGNFLACLGARLRLKRKEIKEEWRGGKGKNTDNGEVDKN